MQFIFQLLLQPILEIMFYGIAYATAWLLVPAFTFGHVAVEPNAKGKKLRPRRGHIQRVAPGKHLMTAELGCCVGMLFWIVVVVGCLLIRAA